MKALPVVVAAVGGALVGAAAALLLAPQSGAETRGDIADLARKYCPGLKKSKLEELTDKLEEELKEAKK